MQVNYLMIAMRRRENALEALTKRQPDLPGMGELLFWDDTQRTVEEPEVSWRTARPKPL